MKLLCFVLCKLSRLVFPRPVHVELEDVLQVDRLPQYVLSMLCVLQGTQFGVSGPDMIGCSNQVMVFFEVPFHTIYRAPNLGYSKRDHNVELPFFHTGAPQFAAWSSFPEELQLQHVTATPLPKQNSVKLSVL